MAPARQDDVPASRHRRPAANARRRNSRRGRASVRQVVHCGAFSKNRKLQRLKRPLGPSRGINLLGTPAGMPIAGAMGPADIDAFVQTFVEAGRLLRDVGFYAAEVHFGHGYG